MKLNFTAIFILVEKYLVARLVVCSMNLSFVSF
jgi:hypothetical protein